MEVSRVPSDSGLVGQGVLTKSLPHLRALLPSWVSATTIERIRSRRRSRVATVRSQGSLFALVASFDVAERGPQGFGKLGVLKPEARFQRLGGQDPLPRKGDLGVGAE